MWTERLCLPKFICCNVISGGIIFSGGAVGRYLGHEDGALMTGVSALTADEEAPSLFPACEDAMRSWPPAAQKRAPTRTCWHDNQGLPVCSP